MSTDGFVYFVRDNKRNLIKIGFSTNPNSRFHQLKSELSSRHLEMLGVMEGGRKKEKELHRQFYKFNVRRWGYEVFESSQELLDFIFENATPFTVTQKNSYIYAWETNDVT